MECQNVMLTTSPAPGDAPTGASLSPPPPPPHAETRAAATRVTSARAANRTGLVIAILASRRLTCHRPRCQPPHQLSLEDDQQDEHRDGGDDRPCHHDV